MPKMYAYLTLFTCTLLSSCTYEPPPATALRYNVKSEVLDGVAHHNSFAAYALRTKSPRLTVRAHTTYQEPYLAQASLAVFVDKHYYQTLHLTGKKQTEAFEVDLPPGEEHEVLLQEGPQQRALEKGPLNFTTITSIEPARGELLNWQALTPAAEGLFVFGDSRVHGGVNEEVGRTAWPMQLRQLHPTADVYVSGYSSLQLGAHIDTPAKRAALTAEIKHALQRYARQTLWIEAGINDYDAGPYTPTQLRVFYRQWLEQVHQALPEAAIKAQTDIVKATESKNKLGYSLPEYRQAEAAAASGLVYVQVLDGLALAQARNLKDGVHLNMAGDSLFARQATALF